MVDSASVLTPCILADSENLKLLEDDDCEQPELIVVPSPISAPYTDSFLEYRNPHPDTMTLFNIYDKMEHLLNLTVYFIFVNISLANYAD